MLSLNNQYFFMRPLKFSTNTMEFEVYTSEGVSLGITSNLSLDKSDTHIENKLELEMFLLDEAIKMEATIKFLKEYGVPIVEVADLNLSAVEIFDVMEEKWNVGCQVLDELIGDLI